MIFFSNTVLVAQADISGIIDFVHRASLIYEMSTAKRKRTKANPNS